MCRTSKLLLPIVHRWRDGEAPDIYRCSGIHTLNDVPCFESFRISELH